MIVEGDEFHVLFMPILICWALFGGVGLLISFAHDVPFGEFIRGGKSAEQWRLLSPLDLFDLEEKNALRNLPKKRRELRKKRRELRKKRRGNPRKRRGNPKKRREK